MKQDLWLTEVKYLDDMIADWQDGKIVTLTSQTSEDDFMRLDVVANHSYMLLAVRDAGQWFSAYNPWGRDTDLSRVRDGLNDEYLIMNRYDMLMNFAGWCWGA